VFRETCFRQNPRSSESPPCPPRPDHDAIVPAHFPWILLFGQYARKQSGWLPLFTRHFLRFPSYSTAIPDFLMAVARSLLGLRCLSASAELLLVCPESCLSPSTYTNALGTCLGGFLICVLPRPKREVALGFFDAAASFFCGSLSNALIPPLPTFRLMSCWGLVFWTLLVPPRQRC